MGHAAKNFWVVIPAYNEEQCLPSLLKALKEKQLNIVVVDDGSTDRTFEVASSCGVTVLKNDCNLGKGGTLRRGIEYVLGRHDADAVVTMDGDGQHHPEEVDVFIKKCLNGSRFVVGNRMSDPKGMPWVRVQTNKIMSWAISVICQQHIPDTQCGFRLISTDILRSSLIETHKFEVESEFLLKAAQQGVMIESVPISSIYSPVGVSKIHPVVDTLRFFRFIFKWFLWYQFTHKIMVRRLRRKQKIENRR